MKATWVVPRQMNIETLVRSLKSEFFLKDTRIEIEFLGPDTFTKLIENIENSRDQLILYTGAAEGERSLSIDQLLKLREHSKTICLNVESSNPSWYPLYESYAKKDVFDLVVGCIGGTNWPRRSQDLCLLGCIDPDPFNTSVEKDILLGACYGPHEYRDLFYMILADELPIIKYPRNEDCGYYNAYANYFLRSRAFINIFPLDQYSVPFHVHFKAFEAGYAKTLFLEKRGGAMNEYFCPGKDYLEYDTIDDVLEIIKDIDKYSEIPETMLEKINLNYSNKQFWTSVFNRLNSL